MTIKDKKIIASTMGPVALDFLVLMGQIGTSSFFRGTYPKIGGPKLQKTVTNEMSALYNDYIAPIYKANGKEEKTITAYVDRATYRKQFLQLQVRLYRALEKVEAEADARAKVVTKMLFIYQEYLAMEPTNTGGIK